MGLDVEALEERVVNHVPTQTDRLRAVQSLGLCDFLKTSFSKIASIVLIDTYPIPFFFWIYEADILSEKGCCYNS